MVLEADILPFASDRATQVSTQMSFSEDHTGIRFMLDSCLPSIPTLEQGIPTATHPESLSKNPAMPCHPRQHSGRAQVHPAILEPLQAISPVVSMDPGEVLKLF